MLSYTHTRMETFILSIVINLSSAFVTFLFPRIFFCTYRYIRVRKRLYIYNWCTSARRHWSSRAALQPPLRLLIQTFCPQCVLVKFTLAWVHTKDSSSISFACLDVEFQQRNGTQKSSCYVEREGERRRENKRKREIAMGEGEKIFIQRVSVLLSEMTET